MEPESPYQAPSSKQGSSYVIPLSIVIAGALIAVAVYFSGAKSSTTQVANNNQPAANVGSMREVSSSDHLVGRANADIVIVEYSDTECPFCKTFHQTMARIMSEYGESGKVAWVYRHFPIAQLHAKAQREAEATECAFAQGGNQAFWNYTNKIFEVTPSNDGLDPAMLITIAQEQGLDVAKFQTCLDQGTMATKVKADYDDALSAGARGTPHSVMIVKKGNKRIPIQGAQSYETVKQLIEAEL